MVEFNGITCENYHILHLTVQYIQNIVYGLGIVFLTKAQASYF